MTRRWLRSPRFWLSAISLVLVAAVVIAAWPTVVDAFHRIDQMDPWVMSLLIPVQLASYAATGASLFSYLRARGELRGMHPLTAMRMSLEFNFANHMLPSGGAAGITYTSWKLSTIGISPAQGTLAQLARFAVTFVSFSLLLACAGVWLISSGRGTPVVLGVAAGVAVLAIGGTAGGALLLRRRRTLQRAAHALARAINWVGRLGTRAQIVSPGWLVRLADGLHREYRAVALQPRALRAPFAWSFLVHVCDAGLFWIALWAFGVVADPALVFVSYGVATVASMVVTTPNGVGAYEVVMVGTLVAGGLTGGAVVAAIAVARVILLLGTVAFGWVFYQHSLARAGRSAPRPAEHHPG